MALAACMASVFSPIHAAPRHIRILAADGQAVPNAAVSVYVKGAKTLAAPGAAADMGQRNKTFVPQVLAVQTGTAVSFPNFDTVRHHVYSFSQIKPFEIKLYAGTPAAPIVFDKPGTATLGCNIHDRMLGYIHVVDTPYFGVTDANGELTLDLPPGEHRLRVWIPAFSESSPGEEQNVKMGNGSVVIQLKP
jgi:plastocyanin